jgi:hypothetical protein
VKNPDDDGYAWRRPGRDGVNCLYLHLRLLGYKGTYEQVLAAVPGGAERKSLADLAKAANRLGFNLVPAKLTVADLSKLRVPPVIIFEEAGAGSGRFDLLLSFFEDQAHLIDGRFMTCHETIPIDRFRRGWTGLALVPGSAPPWTGRCLGIALGGVVAGTTLWLAGRLTRRAHGRRGSSPDATSPCSMEVL